MNVRKFGRGVAMVGAGICHFGSFPQKNTRDLFVEAFTNMRRSMDKEFDINLIEEITVGNFTSDQFEKQGHTGPLIADIGGLVPRPATRVENACASGGVALRQGVLTVASGAAEVVLVVGMEKMTDLPTAEVTDTLITAGDMLYEAPAGFSFPGFYASIASAYMHEYGMRPEHLMHITIKDHANGALNPYAQFGISIPDWMEARRNSAIKKGKPIPTWEDEMEFLHDDKANPMIAWPLRLFDCSPITDGAACVLLAAEDRAKEFSDTPINIIGSAQASDYPIHGRSNLTSFSSARVAAQKVYEMAGVTSQDIKLAEVHDCFTIAEVVATEDLGFFAAGTGYNKAQDGVTTRDGQKPINSSGGLKAKGHPVGASGVAQAVEIWKQMRGEAGERQVKHDLPLALTHNVGAAGSTCVVHIYERR